MRVFIATIFACVGIMTIGGTASASPVVTKCINEIGGLYVTPERLARTSSECRQRLVAPPADAARTASFRLGGEAVTAFAQSCARTFGDHPHSLPHGNCAVFYFPARPGSGGTRYNFVPASN